MSNKFETIEDLEKFTDKLRKTRDTLTKAIDMMEAPENELVKFNEHGQWNLIKNTPDYEGKHNHKKFGDGQGVNRSVHLSEAEKGEGISGAGQNDGNTFNI